MTIIEEQKQSNINLIRKYLKNNYNNHNQIKFLENTKVRIHSICDDYDVELISISLKNDKSLVLSFECNDVYLSENTIDLSIMLPQDINNLIELINTKAINYYYIEQSNGENLSYKTFNKLDDAKKYFIKKIGENIDRLKEKLFENNGIVTFSKENLSCYIEIKDCFMKIELKEY